MKSMLKKIESIPGTFFLKNRLSSSLISHVYECTYNQTKAVIRFDLPAASKLAIDRKNESMLLRNIAHLNISPTLLYENPSTGIMIWEYISGNKPIFDQSQSNSLSLIELGRSLSCLHTSPIPLNAKNIFKNSMFLYEKLLDDPASKILFSRASNLYKELVDDGEKMVFSHNDLHSENLIWNSKYYFLDWEFSSINHPCFDIASLVKSFQLNENQIYDLSKGYKFNHQIFNMNILEKWMMFINFLEQIWETSLTKITKNP